MRQKDFDIVIYIVNKKINCVRDFTQKSDSEGFAPMILIDTLHTKNYSLKEILYHIREYQGNNFNLNRVMVAIFRDRLYTVPRYVELYGNQWIHCNRTR